jgi:hypothetical protein
VFSVVCEKGAWLPWELGMEDRAAYFEALCGRVAGGGDAPAQKELVALRETGNPELSLAIARAVLDKPAAAPFAQFEALSVLEQAVLRSPTHALSVLRYLLARAEARAAREQRAVTRKHLFVAAAIYKRCFQATRVESSSEVDCSPSEFRESVWAVLRAWLGEGQPWETRLLGIELLRNVFTNFCISCSRSLGLTIDYHYRCHCAFEELYLRQVYMCSKVVTPLVIVLFSHFCPGHDRAGGGQRQLLAGGQGGAADLTGDSD